MQNLLNANANSRPLGDDPRKNSQRVNKIVIEMTSLNNSNAGKFIEKHNQQIEQPRSQCISQSKFQSNLV